MNDFKYICDKITLQLIELKIDKTDSLEYRN